jgi:hypothetical protein
MRSDQRMHCVGANVRNRSRHQTPILANQHPNVVNDGRSFAKINYGVERTPSGFGPLSGDRSPLPL